MYSFQHYFIKRSICLHLLNQSFYKMNIKNMKRIYSIPLDFPWKIMSFLRCLKGTMLACKNHPSNKTNMILFSKRIHEIIFHFKYEISYFKSMKDREYKRNLDILYQPPFQVIVRREWRGRTTIGTRTNNASSIFVYETQRKDLQICRMRSRHWKMRKRIIHGIFCILMNFKEIFEAKYGWNICT